ncbi:bifunctional acetate--CoA ligase family protein/GNAT family N-acetyltransferase [Amaricoccus solimangrovi]|uniref:Bifunctional acetate--CoA ligase family protein/GNAT family N-acetyltransferase n=1 Tax=Amaricoccus solimangrovi TaxID=2589815 RepID=A0A501WZN2_9RHOB|nr:bifunctional acetate--CoA ligase family protein/GNAT family N-acetyltransferase [Amaricoccus solimangrovi]TPE53865.1 bifunctional acetate--CoA ligase family protein/GNAT family N-acetyltransferase [Amaricoccus solimangrovi]
MTVRNLEPALRPRSIAVIGASEKPLSFGRVVLDNVIKGEFPGGIWPVSRSRSEILGLPCFPDVASLPGAPDITVIATPAATVPGLIDEVGRRGGRIAVVMGVGFDAGLRQRMLDAARPHLLRVIGPSSAGLIVPSAKLNASATHMGAPHGQIALLSQSASIAFSLQDWAAARGIGFSQIVTLGEMADVDVGDYLDLLASDGRTRVILVYLESIPSPRKFLSAARAVSRLKPVIAIKGGRSAAAARAAATHTGVLSGADQVVEAALRRSGILRVRGLSEMFAAAETIGRFRPLQRARLAIVTNGGAAGVLAVDRLSEVAGELATLAPETVAAIGEQVNARWSGSNPADINGDASAEDYLATMRALAADPGVDVVMAMNTPSGLVSSSDVARALARSVSRGMIGGKPVIASWLGGAMAAEGRGVLRGAGVASYDNPGAAAAAVSHLTNWGRAQAAVLRVPDRAAEEAQRATPEDARARAAAVFARAAAEGRRMLTEPEAKAVLAAYGVPTPATRVARDLAAVRSVAEAMLRDAPKLVVKVISHQVGHKSEVGGVVLGVVTADEAVAAAEGIADRLARGVAGAELAGFALQPMIDREGARELILGVSHDPVFGPVILFGAGGVAVEVVRDTAVALPPLDAGLAADLISQTRVSRLLEGYRGMPPANAVAIQGALIALSHLIEDFPCLRALDVNPLLADAEGVLALDARIEIEPADLDRKGPNPALAIRPYPSGWRREIRLRDGGHYLFRPILPVDATLYPEFHAHLSAEDIRMRFLAPRRSFSQTHDLRQTQLDYDREMAFIAIAPSGEMAGVSRISSDPDKRSAEYALLVRSDMNGRGLGRALMSILIEYARAEGLERLEGMVLANNRGMRRLVESLGFTIETMPEEPEVTMTELRL